MDSFYDAPRLPPAPISRDKLIGVPVVPEISLLCPPSNVRPNNFTPYNQWKQQHYSPHLPNLLMGQNKENLQSPNAPNASILKKQVRFESPVLLPQRMEARQPVLQEVLKKNVVEKGTIPNFEQIYLANIPNRKLDLSVIDLPNGAPECTRNSERIIDKQHAISSVNNDLPRTYKEFLNVQKEAHNVRLNDSVTDIFHYKRDCVDVEPKQSLVTERSRITHKEIDKVPIAERRNELNPILDKNYEWKTQNLPLFNLPSTTKEPSLEQEKKCDSCCNQNNETKPKESQALSLKKDDDFSVKDLLKIITQQSQQIAQQNNQILLLQQQISELVSLQRKQSVENCCCQHKNEKIAPSNVINQRANSTQNNDEPKFFGTPKNNHVSNFSIGLTHSFEVSIRRPPHRNQNEYATKNRILDYEPLAPKIQEVTETESTATNENDSKNKQIDYSGRGTLVDTSMMFKEPIKVPEQCPSPEPSIKINMNDFEDSDSEEDCSQIEASFYRNLMGQVNNILQKAQIETTKELASCNPNGENLSNRTMHKVREATLRHLKTIGVNVPDLIENSRTSSDDLDGKSFDQGDVSFAVKQLLMKYLPMDYLTKVALKETRQEPDILLPKEKIKSRPEFSFATLQYMKKYNLMANNQRDYLSGKQISSKTPKILDISKLKQQPKLL
ncbi:hypothetical protein ABEB36_012076 [Hypothenemus hampei]|uniref:Uncharacterized protein n=1 Tax=Hypothenemus hampei TaxID=57062 RepID=A0ABD1EAN3_HYPHA